jgi:hypothetical protein
VQKASPSHSPGAFELHNCLIICLEYLILASRAAAPGIHFQAAINNEFGTILIQVEFA